MKNIEIYNTLNIDKDSSSIVATFTQEDDAVMEFKLFKDGQEIVLKDQTISLGAERKDGAVIEQEDGFLIKENNVLNITLKKNIIQVVGVVKIQLYLKDKSGEMASNTFNIRVNKKLLGAENVEATNDIKSLNTLVLELKNNTNKLIDDTKAKADKLLSGLQETGDNLSDTVKAKTDKIIEDTKAEVDNIKKDYEGLKKVVIDENISIKLQEDIKILQNGLKTNQNLSYEGSSISAENTLEGRTKGMSIKGLTLQNLWKPISIQWEPTNKWFNALASSINFDITGKVITVKNITNKAINFQFSKLDNNYDSQVVISSGEIKVINVTSLQKFRGVIGLESVGWENTTENKNKLINGLIVCIGEHSYLPNTYFEGLKSFGQAEQEGDKYKIKLLSKNKNFFNKETDLSNWWGSHGELHKGDSSGKKYSILTKAFSGFKYIINVTTPYSFYTFLDNEFNVLGYGEGKNTQVAPVGTRKLLWYLDPGGIDKGLYNKIQVEPGTKSTEYQSYQEDKKDILISAPLRSVYDVQDIMYEDNGQVKVNRIIGEHLVTGDENFITELRNDYLYGYFTLEGSKAGSGLEAICNQFKYIDGLWNKDNLNVQRKEGFDLSGSDSLSFQLPISKLETADTSGLKKYFKNLYNSNNPVIVYYQLATPTIEIVECIDIDLGTFQDKTYFNILNFMPGNLDFKIPSNLASIVQSHTKDIKIIYDLIDRLLIPNLIENKSDLALLSLK
ncbi:hypothetical protein CP118TE_13060 [Clostridium perfringens E]|uniref:phage baseplate upper protein n=1 Tax=Clostridium perfringens TaxID=1502 RepID=UPI0022036ADC|nr:phage baseplate upper protein [Clostridium perfringens]BDC01597.1 hypothetical protein CP118TE_13060 [Clostridium perfringens E]